MKNLNEIIIVVVCLIAVLILSITDSEAHLQLESFYRDEFCQGMLTEVVLPDGTRADCMSVGVVIEVDFSPKWYEATGQALHYSDQTGLHPVVLLILESKKDCAHLTRLKGWIKNRLEKIVVIQTGPYAGLCP